MKHLNLLTITAVSFILPSILSLPAQSMEEERERVRNAQRTPGGSRGYVVNSQRQEFGSGSSSSNNNSSSNRPVRGTYLRDTPQEVLAGVSRSPAATPPASSQRIDLRENGVADQGPLGTCSSFAVVECLQFFHGKNLSQPYLIVAGERVGGDCVNDGLSIGAAMKAAADYGTVAREQWEYQSFVSSVNQKNNGGTPNENWNVCVDLPASLSNPTYAFQNIEYLFHGSRTECTGASCSQAKIDAVRNQLSKGRPVVVSIPILPEIGWLEPQRSPGLVLTPSSVPTNHNKWHAITLYDYDLEYFRFKNSWGAGWGEQGYGKFRLDYVGKFANEAWVGYGAKHLSLSSLFNAQGAASSSDGRSEAGGSPGRKNSAEEDEEDQWCILL